ncbi:MAG: hypothetical protein KBC57_12680 [Neisseriaceae bacterium]|nr:hypothetical protein [Neisseriaceae bacterium]MBP6863195.1 hypothetical protein [Neisseriaceae bacterium]
MNKFAWALLACSSLTLAANDGLNLHYQAPVATVIQEAEIDLPAYPDTQNDDQWISVYTTQTAATVPSLHLDSLAVPGDGTIRYVLNIQPRSKKVDNLSVEALNCKERSYKAYAFGNTFNQTWAANKTPKWIEIRSIDSVRHTLRKLFCDEGMPQNVEALNLLLKKQ